MFWEKKTFMKREKNFHEELKKYGNMTQFMTPKSTGSLEVSVTYFMTLNLRVTVVVGFT